MKYLLRTEGEHLGLHQMQLDATQGLMNGELERLYSKLGSNIDLRAHFITPRQGETNYLEFKRKANAEIPDLGVQDKKNFSKALSAFSNADGGLLIWGVGTRQKDGRDYAFNLKPIKKVEDFAERLRTALLDTVMPQNAAIRIDVLRNSRGNGYVKCLIPASDNAPHRAMLAEREYWIRADGRSARLEHYQIRDMMARRSRPDLDLELIVMPVRPREVKLTVYLQNVGRALAMHAGWFMLIKNATIVSCENCSDRTGLNNGSATVEFTRAVGTVIHPNETQFYTATVVLQKIDPNRHAEVDIKWYCEDMMVKTRNFSVS
ncbi:MAG TPA: ATP-binding protein [Magnetospirillaceae bacterium]|nr:ATP-binding protein [Magnetospirillaceae bacterium]